MAAPENLSGYLEKQAQDPFWVLKAIQGHATRRISALEEELRASATQPIEIHELYGKLGPLEKDFKSIIDLLKSPNELHIYKNPPRITGLDSTSLADLIHRIYDEGYALAESLGPELTERLIGTPQFSEVLRSGTPHQKPFADALGRHHVLRFFDVAVKGNHLEGMYELGGLPLDRYNAAKESLIGEMDRVGLNGIHRVFASNPQLLQALEADIQPVTVPFAKGKPTHGVPVISNMTRSAYLRGERTYVQEALSTHVLTAEQAASYMDRAYHYALGQGYMNAVEARSEAIKPLMLLYEANSERLLTPTRSYLQSITGTFANSPSEESYLAEKWVTIKHGFTLQDPATEALGKPIKEAIYLAKNASHSTHGASAAGAHTSDAGEHSDGKKKITGPSASAQQGAESSVVRPTQTTNQSYYPSETTPPAAKAEVKTSNLGVGSKLALTGAFSFLLYDGLNNIYQKDKKSDLKTTDQSQRSISFNRVVETAVGIVGIIGTWAYKSKTGLETASKLFRS